MTLSIAITLTVVLFLLAERAAIVLATRSTNGRRWIRDHRIMHPNSISLIRIPMGVITVLFWILGQIAADSGTLLWAMPAAAWQSLAVLWFAFWMITDLTDGTIARHCDLTTETGKWLDPLSDKCMYFPPMLYFGLQGVLPLGWVLAFIVIDILGQASRLVVQKKAANSFGKGKTALVTILLSITALNQIEAFGLSPLFLHLLTMSTTVLAFLSVFCKVVPDLWYANSLSLANFICGMGAIWNVAAGNSVRAFVLVFIGQFFDLFDGRLARKYGSTTHGAVFDDIADGTSFGIAIGLLVFHQLYQDLGMSIAAVIALVYVVAVVYRLIRFIRRKDVVAPGVFEGLPSPAGAMLAGSGVLVLNPWQPWAAAALVILAASLMISRVHYRHFGQKIWPALPNAMKLLAFVLVLLYVNLAIAYRNGQDNGRATLSFMLFCLIMISCYLLFGLDYWSRNKPSDSSLPPES